MPNALDWSLKTVDLGKQVVFQLGNYCQTNLFRYPSDDAIPLAYSPLYFFDDKININDTTLNLTTPVQDLFTSIFGATINAPYVGGSIAQLSDPTVTDEFSVGSQARLLIDQKLNLSNLGGNGQSLNIVFSDGDPGFETETISINDVVSVPYFYKPDMPDLSPASSHLGWGKLPNGRYIIPTLQPLTNPGLKDTYYPEFEKILTQAKKVTRYFYLTPADIVSFDFRIPIYLRQDGAYFYVSKIDSWIKGQPCKCDLVKIA